MYGTLKKIKFEEQIIIFTINGTFHIDNISNLKDSFLMALDNVDSIFPILSVYSYCLQLLDGSTINFYSCMLFGK